MGRPQIAFTVLLALIFLNFLPPATVSNAEISLCLQSFLGLAPQTTHAVAALVDYPVVSLTISSV